MDMVVEEDADKEVNKVLDEDEAKVVDKDLVKALNVGLELVDVVMVMVVKVIMKLTVVMHDHAVAWVESSCLYCVSCIPSLQSCKCLLKWLSWRIAKWH